MLAALASLLFVPTARAGILIEDPAGDSSLESPTPGRWQSLAVSSDRSRISSDDHALSVALSAGDQASFSRTADLMPAPSALLCRFNITVSDLGAATAMSQVLRVGWDFETSNRDEADAHTFARLGLVASAGSRSFQLRDFVGDTSPPLNGTQAVTWALNHSGAVISYAAPNGTVERIGNDRMDVWVGREKIFDDVAVMNSNGRMTDLKWYWSQGSGSTRFDRFEIRTLDDASRPVESLAAVTIPAPASAASSDASSIALERPAPNPFTGTTRYAYAISGASSMVEIGIFDIAGRRIRSLAHGTQSAGQYEVRWDGYGDDGSRVRYGVYFLRASIGTRSRVSRLVYLSR
jgi:hypothetical protein